MEIKIIHQASGFKVFISVHIKQHSFLFQMNKRFLFWPIAACENILLLHEDQREEHTQYIIAGIQSCVFFFSYQKSIIKIYEAISTKI